jgi:hypothetical protein
MNPATLAPAARRLALSATAVVAGLIAPIALASTPPINGGHYHGHDTTKGTVTLTVTRSGANFANATFNLVLLGQAGRGSCVGPAHISLHPSSTRQITPQGTFKVSGSFPFREPSTDPQAFRGTGRAIVQGAFSDNGKRVSGTVQLTTIATGLTCRSGLIHFTATLV